MHLLRTLSLVGPCLRRLMVGVRSAAKFAARVARRIWLSSLRVAGGATQGFASTAGVGRHSSPADPPANPETVNQYLEGLGKRCLSRFPQHMDVPSFSSTQAVVVKTGKNHASPPPWAEKARMALFSASLGKR